MKKYNKLFAILFAVLGVTTLKAQTDVTSTYLTNADFSSKDGWTQYISGNYRDIGSGNIGGKLASYAASSTDATHLNSEYFFGFNVVGVETIHPIIKKPRRPSPPVYIH